MANIRAGWPRTAIWWHLYPLGFGAAEGEALPAGELRHRLPDPAWLDHLISLGCNGLLLGPIFDSETHGYDTRDYFTVDRRLGDDHDVDTLIEAAHQRGIRILLDGVFNHVGRSHPRAAAALAEGPESEAGRWLRWTERDRRPVPLPFEGHDQLLTLNHDHQPVIDHVTTVITHWLGRGVDGWRLDAAYQVPAEFWARVLPAVRERFDQAWFVGEMIHGDYIDYVARSGLDSVTQYELWKAIWSSINDGNFYELAWAIERHDQFAAAFLPQTFIGNHDVTRIASILDDVRHLPHAIALLFFLPGTPSIYYGDEFGLSGIKEERVGGDDAIRPAFPATPDDLIPEVDGITDLYRTFIAIRRQHPWLATAKITISHLENRLLALTAVPDADDVREKLILILNTADHAATITLDDDQLTEVAASTPGTRPGTVPGHGWAVLAGSAGKAQ